jgi:hypothetical protein
MVALYFIRLHPGNTRHELSETVLMFIFVSKRGLASTVEPGYNIGSYNTSLVQSGVLW